MKKRTILVVEDDGYIADVLKSLLEANDYRVLSATSGKGALQLAASHVPDVVLLDLGLPDIDGTHVLTSLREWYEGPVIIVSARNQEKEKVQALDMGADDYINKPFSASELLARIRVALRQADKIAASSASPEMSYTVGDLTVDFQNSRVYIAREEVHLTRLEYRIVELLARTPGKVLTHDYIISSVWGALRPLQQQPDPAGEHRKHPPQNRKEPQYAALHSCRNRRGIPHGRCGKPFRAKGKDGQLRRKKRQNPPM